MQAAESEIVVPRFRRLVLSPTLCTHVPLGVPPHGSAALTLPSHEREERENTRTHVQDALWLAKRIEYLVTKVRQMYASYWSTPAEESLTTCSASSALLTVNKWCFIRSIYFLVGDCPPMIRRSCQTKCCCHDSSSKSPTSPAQKRGPQTEKNQRHVVPADGGSTPTRVFLLWKRSFAVPLSINCVEPRTEVIRTAVSSPPNYFEVDHSSAYTSAHPQPPEYRPRGGRPSQYKVRKVCSF